MEKKLSGWVLAGLVGVFASACGEGITGVDRSASGIANKVTICHATGSATNPYVVITIDDNAIPAHDRHQEGNDIIPMPEEGCPCPEDGAVDP
jgi:hypothetical protein